MDPNKAMEAASEGAKALTKFQEIIEKIFGPQWTKKQADADAYADEKKLQTIRDNPDIEIIYVDGRMHARERTPEVLAYRAEQRQLAEAIRQEQNLENVIEMAANEIALANDNKVSDKSIDDDWIARLFQIAKDVSSEEMQLIWGKILAGEIAQPGSFSLKTLDVIRNLTKEDAEAFQKVMPLVMRDRTKYFITSSSEILSRLNIDYETLLRLDECGLLGINETIYMPQRISADCSSFICSNETAICMMGLDEVEREISFGVYVVTRAGCELYQILTYTANDEYCIAFAKEISKRNKETKISVHKINYFDEKIIDYEDSPLKTFIAGNGE